MPQRKRYKPETDAEFIAWAGTIHRDCTQNAGMWNLDPMLLNQFSTLYDTAETKYHLNTNKDLKNRVTVNAKNAAFAVLKSFLSMYINTLEGNPNVPDEALSDMALRPRHPGAHQPIDVPTEAPVLAVIVGQHHDVTVYVSTLQHGHPTHFLKDGKYAGFMLQYKFEGETEWHTVISTKLHHILNFTEAEEGKYIILRAAWVNPRMQNGPWSDEVRELIN
ncbi:MAG: hypothetical protein LBL62_02910 [Planctomycetaceae bacterium]|jgi:hypothetical protein|nr:hypothetical protein [Planctomycetaceae bacterium]